MQGGCIGRQQAPLTPSRWRSGVHPCTPLIARVIPAHRDREALGGSSPEAPSRPDGLGGHIRPLRDRAELVAEGRQGCQDLHPLPPRWGRDPQALNAPDHPPQGRTDTRRGLPEPAGALARLGCRAPGRHREVGSEGGVERTCGARDTHPIGGVVPSGRAGTRPQRPPSPGDGA